MVPSPEMVRPANEDVRGFAGVLALCLSFAACLAGSCASNALDARHDPWRDEERFGTALAARPLVVAHRGSSAEWPENTLPALLAGVDAGADLHEFDTFESAEGVPYLMHDRTLDRTTDADERTGRVDLPAAGVALDFLRRLDAGAWKAERHRGVGVPTLEEALRALGPGRAAMIERKDGRPQPVLEVVRRLGRLDLDVLQSFDWTWLAAVRALEPRAQLGALGSGPIDAGKLAQLAALDVDFVHWKHADLDEATVRELHARGWIVGAYTIDDPARWEELARMGVDFLTTNRPDALVGLQREGGVARPASRRR